jgi:membrane fusion protein (multidrug efflux system)
MTNSNEAGARVRSKGRFNFRASHGLLLGLAVIVVIAGVRLRERLVEPEVMTPPPLLVETLTVTPQPFVLASSYSGSVESEQRATLAARLTTTVTARYVKEGDAVEQGQPLLSLDATEQQQDLARQRAAADGIGADLDYWQGQLKVDQRLFRDGSISEQKLQETQRQVAMLNASLAENRHATATAETRLGYAEVTAPFAGVVQSLLVDTGETVSTGTPLLELVDPQRLKAVINAPQADRGQLAPGLRVYLHLHHLAIRSMSEIGRIYPAVDTISRNVTLDIPFANDNSLVQPGMSVEAKVELARFEAALVVPLQAVQQREGREGVFVVREGRAVWQAVATGVTQGGLVQLLDGIVAGEQVITTPYPALESGSVVQVYVKSEPVPAGAPTV